MAKNYGLVECTNQEELSMNDIRKKEFFELIEEVKTIGEFLYVSAAENLNTVVIDEKIWKIQMQFTTIRDLLGRAEILLKHGYNDEKENE